MDELQKTIDAELKKNAALGKKTFNNEQMEDIVLTSDETKIKAKPTATPENINDADAGSPRREAGQSLPKAQTLDDLQNEISGIKPKGNVTFGEYVEDDEEKSKSPPPPKTIAELLSLEGEVAKNPPKATPTENKLKENLRNISYTPRVESPIVRRLRTLKGDVEEAMKSGKATLVSMASAEVMRQSSQKQELEKAVLNEHRKEARIPTVKSKSQKTLVFVSILVSILLIGAGIAGVYFFKMQALRPVKIIKTPSATSFIPIQFEIKIITDKRNSSYLKANVAAARKGGVGNLNEVGAIYLSKSDISTDSHERALTTKEFLTAFEIRAPEELTRTLSPEFMLGLYRFPENQSFLIFKTDAYETAASGMFAFEYNLEEDIGKFLRTPLDFAYASTTDALTNRRVFKDAVIKNNDARVIYNDKNELLFFYTFLKDRETLIMATNPETLEKIINGLQARSVIN